MVKLAEWFTQEKRPLMTEDEEVLFLKLSTSSHTRLDALRLYINKAPSQYTEAVLVFSLWLQSHSIWDAIIANRFDDLQEDQKQEFEKLCSSDPFTAAMFELIKRNPQEWDILVRDSDKILHDTNTLPTMILGPPSGKDLSGTMRVKKREY